MSLSYKYTLLCLLGLASLLAHANGETGTLRDLDTHCPFDPPRTMDQWQARSRDLRLQLEVSLGLFPKLELDPVQPKIYGKIDRDGYTIEKVTFESLPGFFVTGNLYRPEQLDAGKQIPGILCPHGHWKDGRFYRAEASSVDNALATGAERFRTAARNPIQARCVQLARMGCVVLHWDMIGYCDSRQISFERAHRFAKQSQESEVTDEGWLLYSPLAESHCQSILGLQSLATQRAVDMLLTLNEVDPKRIAITGASGGGTQSFIGAALDERISVAFPAVMVSTGMQGGCTCENACLLRTGTGNVEMAGLIAPRPLGLTAADDWTKTMPDDGFPELKKLYGLFDVEDQVQLFPAIHFGHNYNHVSRTSMYGWMNKYLELGFDSPVLERDFDIALRDELTVWDAEHPEPPSGDDFERELMALWEAIVDGQLSGLLQGDRRQVEELATILTKGWRVCLGLTTSHPAAARMVGDDEGIIHLSSSTDGGWTIRRLGQADESIEGSVMFTVGVGESKRAFAFGGVGSEQQSLVFNPRLAAAYTYGYNMPKFSKAARRLALSLQFLDGTTPGKPIVVTGKDQEAALSVAGVFVLQQLTVKDIDNISLAISPNQFSFENIDSIVAPSFLPGAARYWGLPGLAASLDRTKITLVSNDGAAFTRLRKLHALTRNALEVHASHSRKTRVQSE